MGLITLGIGPPEPNVTYLVTGGLTMPEPAVAITRMTFVLAVRTLSAAIRQRSATMAIEE